jgi:hypothetical protein
MGMFDEILVKKELPLPDSLKTLYYDWPNYKFQTKSLDNYLGEYFIDENGDLYEIVIEREYVEYSVQELKSLNNKFFLPYKNVIEKSRSNKKLDYHGVITFYTYEELDEDNDFSVDFDAYFVYGKLDKIVLKEFKTYKSRKKESKKWEEEFKAKYNHPIYKFKRFLSKYLGWSWFFKKISFLLYKTSSGLNTIQYFINRKLL